MTPASKCRALGFNLNYASEVTGINRQTLANWSNHRPKLFEIILQGILATNKDNMQIVRLPESGAYIAVMEVREGK